ncbi:hypothetical protein ACTMSW_09430 [Micromonospora sp. BQ11]|uniref:hypothetical protein n=1 Tax=Micromonospora sp. BQ11 TaxID=3452212 RepID=UPI003F887C58
MNTSTPRRFSGFVIAIRDTMSSIWVQRGHRDPEEPAPSRTAPALRNIQHVLSAASFIRSDTAASWHGQASDNVTLPPIVGVADTQLTTTAREDTRE